LPSPDLVVRCFTPASASGDGYRRPFFTVHHLSSDELVAGPFSTLQVAIDVARSRGTHESVSVWLELSPGSNNLEQIG
jgi:hypothetical protein